MNAIRSLTLRADAQDDVSTLGTHTVRLREYVDSPEMQPPASMIRAFLEGELFRRLDRIESAIAVLTKQNTIKDYYSTDEAAVMLIKAPFTVREWCRLGRIRGDKRACGRGNSQEWMISHAELQRIRSEGLLPIKH